MAVFSLIVTSDRVYRGEREDLVTPLVEAELSRRGHRLAYKTVVPNDWRAIEEAIREACSRARIVLVTGGTGLSPRDISVDVASSMARKRVPGFGEAHRRISWSEVGERAVMSRADAFIVGEGCFVAVSPGNPNAVAVALRILAPIADHIVDQLEGKPHG